MLPSKCQDFARLKKSFSRKELGSVTPTSFQGSREGKTRDPGDDAEGHSIVLLFLGHVIFIFIIFFSKNERF